MSDASRLRRLQRLTAAVRNHVGSNTAPFGHSSDADIAAIEKGASILASGLAKLAGGTTAWPSWEASTDYAVDEVAEPVVRNGYRYAVTTAGTTGATEPTWGTTVDGTTNDGTVVWTNIGLAAFGMWDAVFDQWNNEAAMLAGAGSNDTAQTWTTLTEGVMGGLLVPSTRNGCVYQSIITRRVTPSSVDEPSNFAYHGVDEPGWPTDENGGAASRIARAFADSNTTDWRLAWRYWGARRQYAVGAIARPGNGRTYKVTTAGVSDTTEPTWPTTSGGTVSDGTVTWTEFSAVDVAIAPTDAFFERYVTAMTDCLAAAGISVNFDFAGVNGDGCWQEIEAQKYWWVYQGSDGSYTPVQTGVYYHACKYFNTDEGIETATTKEFGFGPKIGCPELLQEGDILRVKINGTGASARGYQEGDLAEAQITNAIPLEFGGGQIGNDTLTWSVNGSVSGALDDYSMVTTALIPYEDTDIGLAFSIAVGGVPFAVGDKFTFSVEGGRVQVRYNGGSWVGPTQIVPTISLDYGLEANFSGGLAPSWVIGDKWSFLAKAVNGPDAIRQPTEARMIWENSTVLQMVPDSTDWDTFVIADHTIPAGATIELSGSNDDFSTTEFVQSIAWRSKNMLVRVGQDCEKYRLTVNMSGSIQWVWAGTPLTMTMFDGQVEHGILEKEWRMATPYSPRRLDVKIDHTFLSQTSMDNLLSMMDWACLFDQSRFGVIPNFVEGVMSLVEYDTDRPLKETDALNYQPENSGERAISVTLELEAAA